MAAVSQHKVAFSGLRLPHQVVPVTTVPHPQYQTGRDCTRYHPVEPRVLGHEPEVMHICLCVGPGVTV